MAKIKIKGHNEFLTLIKSKAIEIKKVWLDDDMPNDTKINIGDTAVKKGEITGIFLDQERSDDTLQAHDDYYRERDLMLEMTSKEKANNNAWGHFNLFHFAAFNKEAPQEMRDQVFKVAEKFFEENPEWTVPSSRIWAKMLGLEKDHKMSKTLMDVLERIEDRQLIDKERTRKFKEGRKEIEEKEQAMSEFDQDIDIKKLWT